MVRLKEQWTTEFEQWSRRDLSAEQYVCVLADGIPVNVRLEDDANIKGSFGDWVAEARKAGQVHKTVFLLTL